MTTTDITTTATTATTGTSGTTGPCGTSVGAADGAITQPGRRGRVPGGARARVRATTVAAGAGLGVALALAADLAVYAVGAVGAPVRVVTGAAPDGADLTVAEVAMSATVAVALGAVCLWLLERRGAAGFRRWVGVVAVVAVASSVPLLRLDVDAGSKVALATMHLATGAAAVAGQVIARNRRAGGR